MSCIANYVDCFYVTIYMYLLLCIYGDFMTTTVRKNFVLDKTIADHLELLAKESQQSMTALIQEMIEERYKIIKVRKRLKALELMTNSASELLTNESIQSLKGNKRV